MRAPPGLLADWSVLLVEPAIVLVTFGLVWLATARLSLRFALLVCGIVLLGGCYLLQKEGLGHRDAVPLDLTEVGAGRVMEVAIGYPGTYEVEAFSADAVRLRWELRRGGAVVKGGAVELGGGGPQLIDTFAASSGEMYELAVEPVREGPTAVAGSQARIRVTLDHVVEFRMALLAMLRRTFAWSLVASALILSAYRASRPGDRATQPDGRRNNDGTRARDEHAR